MRSDILPITGALLAGGLGSRMGGKDKGLLLFQGRPLYQHVQQNLQLQVDSVVINANRNLDSYAQSGLPIISDSLPDHPGPLAGMLAVLAASPTPWVAFAPCDMPWLPFDWINKLWQQKGAAPAAWVKSHERDHPALTLLNTTLRPALQFSLAQGERRLSRFLSGAGGHAVTLEDEERCFANMNTPQDLERADG
ncbi:molybdopterin-guanine dinucleotide biosynthesis protein A [Izhakiella capsodis]|uniref:Molybdenum cofactor guanylyltransferase n=1 Tax=Izhakiella capsodis TaxID=1367852 RepID=A0A1I5A6A2_9GAMM|nr:molybdenum cofactor guanylyltransferase MobA [Izhakiella capsodis]SFN57992.1 molybdopterin-guanine dinucleotide biosynthesis protein A [Izhakiella capsodis]